MTDPFKDRLTRSDVLLGTIITLPSTEVVEIVLRAGFDWLFMDLEHSAMSIRDAQRHLQVAGADIPCLVRVPSNEDIWIKQALDIGAHGVIVPQVHTADDVRRAVQAARYPPEGTRSVGIARAHGYGDGFQEYVAAANRTTAVVVQIEHVDAVADIERILEVPGVDGLFVGPYDLSASMGKPGHVSDRDVQDAIDRVTKAAGHAGIPLGIFGATAAAVEPYIRKGYTLIAVGMDIMLIGKAAKETADSCRAVRAQRPADGGGPGPDPD